MTYGLGTRSYNRSTEARREKQERAKATAEYAAGKINPFDTIDVPLNCRCPQRPWPHELTVHANLRSDWSAYGQGQSKNSWPWSLRFVEGE